MQQLVGQTFCPFSLACFSVCWDDLPFLVLNIINNHVKSV